MDSEAEYFRAQNIITKNSLRDVQYLKMPMIDVDDEVDMNGERGDENCVDTHSHQSEKALLLLNQK